MERFMIYYHLSPSKNIFLPNIFAIVVSPYLEKKPMVIESMEKVNIS